MKKPLPSLVALKSFEAAARLGSFKAAADELAVTPTAVSHQIRSLEERLELALFLRKTRGIELTEAGANIAPALTRAFDDIRHTLESETSKNNTITIATTPSFATLFLVPRLLEFYQLYPHYSVQLNTSTKLVDLHYDRHIDLAIRYGNKHKAQPKGIESLELFSETFGVYLAPELAASEPNFKDLTLIETIWQQDVLANINWQTWLNQAKEPKHKGRVIGFDEEAHVLQAAIAGKGAALASSVLAKDLIQRKLLTPYKHDQVLAGQSYNLTYLVSNKHHRKVEDFIQWIQSDSCL